MKPKPKGRKLRGKRGNNVRKLNGVTPSSVKMATCSKTSECVRMAKSDPKPSSVKRLTTAMKPKSVKRPNCVKKHSCVKRRSSARRPSSVRRLSSATRPKCVKRPNYVTRLSSAKSESRMVTGMRQESYAGN